MLATIETSITATALVTIGEYFSNSVTVSLSILQGWSPLTLSAGNMGGSGISLILHGYVSRQSKHSRPLDSDKQIPGFAIIFTRLSDGIGREPAVIIAYVLFAAFSLGGGLAQTLGQLIALRFLQGIGGAGLYSMLMVIGVEISPVEYWGALSGMIGLMLATGSVLGIHLTTVSLATGRCLLCHYRTYPWWCHYRKGVVALDLPVQRPCRCRGNSSHAYLLAAKREIIQEAQYYLAVDPPSGLGGCHPTAGSLHLTGLCPPRRWK